MMVQKRSTMCSLASRKCRSLSFPNAAVLSTAPSTKQPWPYRCEQAYLKHLTAVLLTVPGVKVGDFYDKDENTHTHIHNGGLICNTAKTRGTSMQLRRPRLLLADKGITMYPRVGSGYLGRPCRATAGPGGVLWFVITLGSGIPSILSMTRIIGLTPRASCF